ncbi:MAG: glycogen/starch synthase [Chitinispirillales bacterium]|jgi:glycogen synthase|nr:glycogen/starch synthase [Chitinispirillales bacterium]
MKKRKYTPYDAAFTAKIDAWQPLAHAAADVLGTDTHDALNVLERKKPFRPGNRKIVSLTFENNYAPLGGLAAVMRFFPAFLQKTGEDSIVMTPLYTNIPAVKKALAGGELEPVLEQQKFSPYSKAPYEGTVSCYRGAETQPCVYFVSVDGRFTAEQNPYSYDDSDDILDDALAFCAAVPFVLARLGFAEDILFHAHDWETAPIALASKFALLDGVLESARTVLTLHNSFDSGISADRKKLFFGDGVRGDTVLRCAIPLLNGPLTTVSTPFARELRDDPLQRTVFTSHLQDVFSINPPVGIENGMFGRPYLRYTYTALSRARQGDVSKLLEQKARFRERMLEIAGGMGHSEVIGSLRDVDVDCRRPIFFMSGRLDLTQKGFDVIFQAIKKFPAGEAGLIFSPSGVEAAKSSEELAFFREVAGERPGDIVIWPFRVPSEDYAAVVSGSSFLLMPSFYEPFGAATEGFMHGTPVMARATGGLLAQVRPAGAGDKVNENATGILYRECAESFDPGDWRRILDAPVGRRIDVPLYQSMVGEAYLALEKAVKIFADGQAYGRMMLCGMDGLGDFSWDAAVWKYRRVYAAASGRGFFDT